MDECIFCKIIKGEIPCKKVYEDDSVLCFNDINPEAPVHVLIIPKTHISSINDLKEEHSNLMGHIFIVAAKLAKELNISDEGYRIVTNCGEKAGQTVPHIHFHMLAGRNLQWPPG
jgi:histidine triad (HIT) family protein